jgi:hypothetical protein
MATPIHRAFAAQKHTCQHGPHDLHAHRVDAGQPCTREERKDRERPEQKVRKRARTFVGDDLDFVFRL